MKSALITGGSGWLGFELVKQLIYDGYQVKAMDRVMSQELISLKKLYPERLILIQAELDELDKWEKEFENLDYLYHFAAKVHSKPTNKEDIDSFFYINRDMTKLLFDKAKKYGVKKVIFISSVSVYGNNLKKQVNSDDIHLPDTPYAESKHEAEMYGLEMFKDSGFPIVIIQPVTVYGKGDRGNFKKLYNLSQKGLTLKFGNGENVKSVIYYKDLILMIKLIAQDSKTKGRTFICGTELITYNNILKKYHSKARPVIKIVINEFFSKILINLLKNGTRKMKNISEMIHSLMSNNSYDFSVAKMYLKDNEITYFESWLCDEEYK